MQTNSPELWQSQLPRPKPDGHKYDRGIALIAAGVAMTGAACLAARAAQRAGAGVVWVHAPAGRGDFYRLKLDSCIIKEQAWPELLGQGRYTAALIGPGYGTDEHTRHNVLALLAEAKPCVLDADALSAFADHRPDLLKALHSKVVLTPHMGEFNRLFDYIGTPEQKAQQAAQASGAVVVLKGHHTVIAAPEGELVINTNAPPDLATAGSGDVLAGLITGLLVQGMPPFLAACAGIWLHGAAASAFGPGLIAEDIHAMIPVVLRGLFVTKT